MAGPLDQLFVMENRRSLRASSFDRTGGNDDNIRIEPGKSAVIADIKGAGVIKHIWFTIATRDPMFRRNGVLKMYWDDEEYPSVLSPIGDFFGQGWGEFYNFISLPLAAAPVGGRAHNSYFPMPFLRSARIEIENQSAEPVRHFYFYVDYELFPSDKGLYEAYGVGDGSDREIGYFHAWWNREVTTPEPDSGGIENEWSTLGPTPANPTDKGNYLLLEAKGRGHVVGLNYFVDSPTPMWYGEGDDMWLIDGEEWPGSLHGTGTEDLFNTSWCPNEVYQHPYFGYARVPNKMGWMGRTHAYRFWLDDPIRFTSSIRGSIEHGHANVLTLDLSSVAYWYQTRREAPLPALPSAEDRANMPSIGVAEVHRWRHAWRQALLAQRKAKGEPVDRVTWGHERIDG